MKVSPERISALLEPYLAEYSGGQTWAELMEKLSRYLQLLVHWNARTNLTSIRDPEEMVQRHFGESLFLATKLRRFGNLLDIGSGAGFPGIPIAMLHHEAKITLAESQGKKAAFLREAVWMLSPSTKVWADRTENMPASSRFDVVTLRAVDQMALALQGAMQRLNVGSILAYYIGERGAIHLPQAKWSNVEVHSVPNSSGRLIVARLEEFHVERS